ncbi:MAG TPA: O-antigen ligase family protein, partial [Candidatus Limnocylindrales bacterium]|nr:O-antigen ligase family protein [Candidatus Limnocylindrales bacterium]
MSIHAWWGELTHGRAIAEIGLSAYLLMIPAGPALPAWPRDLALVAAFGGLLLASLPGRRGAAASPGFAFLVPLALFAGSAALSTVLSTYPDRSLVRAAYAPIAWLLFLVAQAVAVTPAAYRRLLLVLAAVVAIVGADGLVQLARGRSLLAGSVPLAGRLSASLPHPNDLALIPVLLPVVLAGLVAVPATRMTRGLLAAQPLAIATAIGSASRNAWLGLALGLGLLGALAWPIVGAMRRRLVAGAGVIALVLFVAGFAFSIGAIPERARRLLDPAQEPRFVLWRVAGTMFRDAPVVGMGVHTFEEFHRPLVEALALSPTTVRDTGP